MIQKGVIIDGYNLIFRAFYGYKRLIDSKKFHTAQGVFMMITALLERYNPTHLIVAQDKGKSFRHEQDPRYKAQRPKTPEVLLEHIPLIWNMIEVMGIPLVCQEGYEADDIIGSIAVSSSFPVHIISADMDLAQVVNNTITFSRPKKGQLYEDLDRDGVYSTFGIYPEHIPLYKALAGDSADNILGVRGIGTKGAQKIIELCSHIENIEPSLHLFPKSVQESLLKTGIKNIQNTLTMTTLKTDLPINIPWDFTGFSSEIVAFLEEHKFFGQVQKARKFLTSTNTPSSTQMSLF